MEEAAPHLLIELCTTSTACYDLISYRMVARAAGEAVGRGRRAADDRARLDERGREP